MLLHAPKVQTNCREFLSCSPLWSVTANAEHTTAHTRKHLSIMRFSSRRTSKTIASNKLSYLFGALNFTGSFQFLTLMEIELYLPKQRGGIAKGIKGIYIWQGHKESICSKWRVEGRCLRGTLNGALSSSHSRLVSWLSSTSFLCRLSEFVIWFTWGQVHVINAALEHFFLEISVTLLLSLSVT